MGTSINTPITGTSIINNLTNFIDVKYDPRALKEYFYLTRYKMIEELVLDFNNTSDYKKNEIYKRVEEYVKDNLGEVNLIIKRPLILSIIGDLFDIYLLSNVKKAIYDGVTEIVNEQINPDSKNELITQSVNPTNIEINYNAVDFDFEFGLN